MKFILLLSIFFSLSIKSQEKFSAKGIYCDYYKYDTEEFVSEQAIGKNVRIIHDTFFNSWKITFENEDGELKSIILKYIQGNDKMEYFNDELGHKWYILNNIKAGKNLILAPDKEPVNGLFNNLVIREVMKQK